MAAPTRSALALHTALKAARPVCCTPSCSARPYSTNSVPSSSSSSSAPPPATAERTGSRLYSPPLSYLAQHVNSLLAPLRLSTPLSQDVLQQALTHKSAINKGRSITPSAAQPAPQQHGERLAFVGRRVLRMHYTMHLNSALQSSHPDLLAQYLSQDAVDRALETKELGSNVGRVWGLEKALRWREVRGPNGEMTGLYKSRGSGVEALVGAVYTQNGIAASAALFEQLILPNLALPPRLAQALNL